MGYVVLILLTSIQLFAACGVASRGYDAKKAEGTLAAVLVALYLILAPMYALGYANLLTAWTLGASTTILTAITWRASAWDRSVQQHFTTTREYFLDVVTSPARAIQLLRAESRTALVALLALYGIAAFTFVLSWQVPSSSWDGVWYHDAIVFFAIQNHGFAMIPNVVEATNGFARGGELITLWTVIFTDARLADGTNCFSLLLIACTTYALIRRYGIDRAVATVCAVALALMPGCHLQLRSSYVDLTACTLSIAVAHFATKPNFRIIDAIMTAVAAGLALASKGNTLVWAPPLALISVTRTFFIRPRVSIKAIAGVIVFGTILTSYLAAWTYTRNWITNHNPLYPVPVDFAPLNIHWHGTTGNEVTDINVPFKAVLTRIFGKADLGDGAPDIRHRGYGLAVPWVVAPLAAIGACVGVFHLFTRRRDRAAGLVGVGMVSVVWISPAIWWARYNIHHVAGMLLLAAVAMQAFRSEKTRHACIGALLAFVGLTLAWHDGYWGVEDSFAAIRQGEAYENVLLRIAPAVLRERERLGQGDAVVVSSDYIFAALFFNRKVTNTVRLFPDGAELLAAANAPDVRMVVIPSASPSRAALTQAGWHAIDAIDRGRAWTAFKR